MAKTEPWLACESDNLTGLTELNETSLLESIKARYGSSSVYTSVGDILVAVNPFRQLHIYEEAWSAAYVRPDVSAMAPHTFKVAGRAYNAMVRSRRDQVCVISGESGAGKTESSKFIMRQVMRMCRSTGLGQKLQERIVQLNPVLEAFGNASTALNDNSSRFGKYIQLVFEPSGRIVGAGLEQYLLEKSRVCVQGENERNFHIFYYLYAGLDSEMLKQLLLSSPSKHRCLRSYSEVEADCTSPESRSAFNAVLQSMETIGFEEDEIQQVLISLAAIILIGDIEFEGVDGGEDGASVTSTAVVESVARLLKLESTEELTFVLTTLRTTTRGETVDKLYSCSKAADVRDAVAKALYARMFQWIVARLNGYLQPRHSPDHLHIGILDIFGFENFETNSFEQFCINLANEQLQQYFNHQIFAMEKVEYGKEGLEGLDISFNDNTPVLNLFLTRPIGLFSLLDEQCRGFNGSEKAFVQRCRESFGKHPTFVPNKGNALKFTVLHYAGRVQYNVSGFVEKNKDSLPENVTNVMRFSGVRLVRVLFTRFPSFSSSILRRTTMNKSQRHVMRAMSRRKKSVRKVKPGAGRVTTVGAQFRQSLELLMERVFAAAPHFVRCIKPNMEKIPGKFDDDFVLEQLRYTGMLEAVRVRREGFAYRPFFSDFFQTFRALAYAYTDKSVKSSVSTCTTILEKAGLTGWRLGRSRVFLRYFHEDQLRLMTKDLEDKAMLIQRCYRGYAVRRWVAPLRERQREEKEIVTDFLSALSDHGQECFPGLLVINRVDNLLAIERFGNQRPQNAPSEDSEHLSEAEKKKNRAKKFGVMLPFAPGIKVAPKGGGEREEGGRSESEEEGSGGGGGGVEITLRRPLSIDRFDRGSGESSPAHWNSSNSSPAHRGSTDSSHWGSTDFSHTHRGSTDSSHTHRSSTDFSHTHRGSTDSSYTYRDSISSEHSLTDQQEPSPTQRCTSDEGITCDSPLAQTTVQLTVLEDSKVPAARVTPEPRVKRLPGAVKLLPSVLLHPQQLKTAPPVAAKPASNANRRSGGMISPQGDFSPTPQPDHSGPPKATPDHFEPPAWVTNGSDSPAVALRSSPCRKPRKHELTPSEPARATPRFRPPPPPASVDSKPNLSPSPERMPPKVAPRSPFRRAPPRLASHSRPVSQSRGEPDLQPRGEPDSRGVPVSGATPAAQKGPHPPEVEEESTLDFKLAAVPNGFTRTPLHPVSNGTSGLHVPAGQSSRPSSTEADHSIARHLSNGGGPVEKAFRGMSSPSAPLSSPSSSSPHTPGPSTAERKAGFFSFGRCKHLKQRKGSSDNGGTSASDAAYAGTLERDGDTLGFYADLRYEKAMDMVLGQPRGTYVVHHDIPKRFSMHSSAPLYILVVSEGAQRPSVYQVCSSVGAMGDSHLFVGATGNAHLHVEGSSDGQRFPSLKSLLEHYRRVAISGQLVLLYPRLVAGVPVPTTKPRRRQLRRSKLSSRKT